jgi:4-amino-4-deoxy-L-arabinose transferase-like glycosyltransferase
MGVNRTGWLLLPMLLAAALFLPALGARTIYISDEARYALLARNMIERGHWLVPHIGGEVHMEKPPLFMWAIALVSLIPGDVTELTAALPAAVSGIAGVAVTFLLGRRLFGPGAGLLGAIVLATTSGYFSLARAVLADMTMTLFILCSVWAFWSAVETSASGIRAMIVCYVCLGLALSTKGPAGLTPLLAFAAFLLAEGGWRGLRRLRLPMGIAIVALIASPWAIAFALQREASYVQTVLRDDYLGPHVAMWEGVRELFFAAGPLGVKFLPWSLFLPAALYFGCRDADAATRRAFRFLICWAFAYVVVITLMTHKRERYLLPVYPAVALMVGWLWQRWISSADRRALRVHSWLWGALATAAGIALLLPLRLRTEEAILLPPSPTLKLAAAAGIVVSGAVGLWAASTGRPRVAVSIMALTTASMLTYEAWTIGQRHNERYDVKEFARRVADHVGPGDDLLAFESARLSYDFYLRRPVKGIRDGKELVASITRARPVYVIADERAWRNLDASGLRLQIVERTKLAGRAVMLANVTR